MRKFHPVYYIISGWPSMEKTLEMVDRYVEHGVTALQFDMPSRDPSRESEFIQERMRHALGLYKNYEPFMEMLRQVRVKYPALEIHLVVYLDVVREIGLERFADFCLEIDVYSLLAMGREEMKYMHSRGIPTATFIGYDLSDEAIAMAKALDKQIVFLNNKKEGVTPRPGCETWAQRVRFIREQGVAAPIFGVTGIVTPEELLEVKQAGADGAYIGTILMKLWEDESKLWPQLDAFQAVAE